MKRKLIFFLIIVFVALVQVTLLDCVQLFGVKPDILLLLIIVCGLYFSPGWALGYSVVAGSCKDIFTATGWGVNTVLFAALSMLLVVLHKRIRFENYAIRVSVAYLVFLAYYCVSVFLLSRVSVVPTGILMRTLILGPVYGAAIFFLALRWIDRALKPFVVSSDSDEEPDFDPDFEANM